MRRLNLDQLRTFSRIIDFGSFSAVADRLDDSQPAVSLQVRQARQFDLPACMLSFRLHCRLPKNIQRAKVVSSMTLAHIAWAGRRSRKAFKWGGLP
jgi:hypothetical protein